MITHVGFIVLAFSSGVLVVALLGLLAGLRWRWLVRPATRMAAVFGVFALAGGYIWLQTGPDFDLRIHATELPQIRIPEIRSFDI